MAGKKNQDRVLPGSQVGGSRTTDTMFDNAFGTPPAPVWDSEVYNQAWRTYNDAVSRGTFGTGEVWYGSGFNTGVVATPTSPLVNTPVDGGTRPATTTGGKKNNNGGKSNSKPKKKNVISRLVNNFSKKPKQGDKWKISPGGYSYQVKAGNYRGQPGAAGTYKTKNGQITYFNPADGSPPSNWYGSGNAQTTYDNVL